MLIEWAYYLQTINNTGVGNAFGLNCRTVSSDMILHTLQNIALMKGTFSRVN